MTTVALLLIAIILATRIPLLLWDQAVKRWQAILVSVLQIVVTLTLLKGAYSQWVLVLLLALGNLIWYQAEHHTQWSRHVVRLATLLGVGLMTTVMASTWFGLSFRDLHPILAAVRPWFEPVGLLERLSWRAVLTTGIGLMLCLNEANLLIRLVIDRLSLKPKDPVTDPTDKRLINKEYQRGRIIGILERLTIFTLVFTAQYSAMGFVLAAKAMARFKTLDDRDFAEYFLVGTLLSVVLAGGLALAVRRALG